LPTIWVNKKTAGKNPTVLITVVINQLREY